MSTPMLLRILEDHPEIRDCAVRADSLSGKCSLPASLVGTCMWLFNRLDANDCEFFFDRLADGQNMQKGDPIYELRRTVADTKASPRSKPSTLFLMAITIKAWNAFREGRSATNQPVGLYRWKPGGAKPEPFPEPF